MNFKNLPLTQKMVVFVAAITILNVSWGAWTLYSQKEMLTTGKQRQITAVVDAAYSIAAGYEARAKAGALPVDEAKSAAMDAIRELRYADGDYVWINDMNHVVVMHPIKPALDGQDVSGLKDPAGTFVFREFVNAVKANGSGFVNYQWPKPGFEQPVEKTSFVKLLPGWNWVLGSGLYLDDVQAEFRSVALQVGLSVLAVTAAMLGFTWLFARNVARPLTSSVSAVQRLADEDLSVEDGDDQRKDEIGDLSRAIASFKSKLRERQELARQQAAEQLEKERRRDASERLIRDFSATMAGVLERLSEASDEMSSTAETVHRSASTTTDQAVTVSAAAEQASVNVQTVSSAAQEMAASIAEVTRQVGAANSVTGEAQVQAKDIVNTVSRLQAATGQITEVVDLISSIAAQTNLLALNATIEAARAGDAGKGFAVVAGEVKGLATQTASATADISRQIQEMQEVSGEATGAIAEIADVIERIGSISASVAAAMDQQNAATQEIVRSVEEVASGTSMVAESITSVRTAASDSRGAAESVAGTASHLAEQTATLRSEIKSFLAEITRAGERRNFDRKTCDLPATVETASGPVTGRLVDIGLGGAHFGSRISGRVGDGVSLIVEGQRISAQIVEIGDSTRLRFSLDTSNQHAVEAITARIAA
ncbi:cache domain-containing protein [Thalassobaculum sp. OXR-137]|uniref:cache domain-containing protein n=1 Tax=Thalassobaculum sp. OXR-137 TaxID=3100173 RepID=UPI002AC9321F|nr:cache domain-containing protein [Thalassobaculum sp. OXR-137]WPZ32373.1 cache domain-containing protein [Thalassobaculum sp. OXR-137]